MIEYETKIIKNLVNINTTRNNFNEIEAAMYLKNEFINLGVDSTIYEPFKGRGSIVAKIDGLEEDNVLLYSHLDTDEYTYDNGWKVRPDTATVIKNRIYGRGTLDCKGLTAIWMGVFKKLIQSNIKPKKTLLFIASSDEESGGEKGIKWLLNNTNHFKKTFLVLSEGGGYPLRIGNSTYFTIQIGERERIVIRDYNEKYIKSLYSKNESIIFKKGILLKIDEYKRYIENYINDYLNYNSPNRKIPLENFNDLIIKETENDLLVHKLPYLDDNAVLTDLTENDSIIEKISTGKNRHDSFCLEIIQRELSNINCNFKLLPFVTPGYSDNRYFRINGIDTIGFFPLDYNNGISGIHGPNEYITQETIKFSSEILFEIIKKIAL